MGVFLFLFCLDKLITNCFEVLKPLQMESSVFC